MQYLPHIVCCIQLGPIGVSFHLKKLQDMVRTKGGTFEQHLPHLKHSTLLGSAGVVCIGFKDSQCVYQSRYVVCAASAVAV